MRSTKRKLDRTRAIALVITLGVLTLLSTLGICFIRYSCTERSAAAGYLESVRATMVAEAGLWRAVCGVRESNLDDVLKNLRGDWAYQGNERGSTGMEVPLEEAQYPSYWWIGDQKWVKDEEKPEPVPVYGRYVSGVVGGTYEPNGDTYTLKVMDTSSQINLNAPSLALILDYLGQAIAYYNNVEDPVKGKGSEIVALREKLGGRFYSKDFLSSVLKKEDLNRLWNYVTVASWVDPSTIARDPSLAEDHTGQWITEPRAPVNINIAPKPVLVALLVGLSNGSEEISFNKAVKVVDAIEAYRNSNEIFWCWEQFNLFIDTLTEDAGSRGILTPLQANIIKVNANPNVSIRGFNPDKVIYQSIDKTDLTYHTTEFCFASMGFYEIFSLGRITRNNGNILSQRTISSVVKIHSVIRDTTQANFWNADKKSIQVGAFPNHLSHESNNNMGYMELLPWEDISYPPDLTFSASYDYGMGPDFAGGEKKTYGKKDSTTPLSMGGDLAMDGVLIRETDEEYLAYDADPRNLPIEKGLVSFWVKFNENTNWMESPIFFSDSPLPHESGAGIQMILLASITSYLDDDKNDKKYRDDDKTPCVDGNNNLYLNLTAIRYLYDKRGYLPANFPFPYKYRKVTVQTNGIGFFPHQWYRIIMSWRDGTDISLEFKGGVWGSTIYVEAYVLNESGTDYQIQLVPKTIGGYGTTTYVRVEHEQAGDFGVQIDKGLKPYEPRIYIGKGPDSKEPPKKNLTIDDFQIYCSLPGDSIIRGRPRYSVGGGRYKLLNEGSPSVIRGLVERLGLNPDCFDLNCGLNCYGMYEREFKLPPVKLKVGPMAWTAMNVFKRESLHEYSLTNVEINTNGQTQRLWRRPPGAISVIPEKKASYSYKVIYMCTSLSPDSKSLSQECTVSSVLDDISLYYQEPLQFFSYRFTGE